MPSRQGWDQGRHIAAGAGVHLPRVLDNQLFFKVSESAVPHSIGENRQI